jgi:hypothetical protein
VAPSSTARLLIAFFPFLLLYSLAGPSSVFDSFFWWISFRQALVVIVPAAGVQHGTIVCPYGWYDLMLLPLADDQVGLQMNVGSRPFPVFQVPLQATDLQFGVAMCLVEGWSLLVYCSTGYLSVR